jgi:transposase
MKKGIDSDSIKALQAKFKLDQRREWQVLRMMERKNTVMTITRVIRELRWKHSVKMSRHEVGKILKRNDYSWKRLRTIQAYVNKPINILKR